MCSETSLRFRERQPAKRLSRGHATLPESNPPRARNPKSQTESPAFAGLSSFRERCPWGYVVGLAGAAAVPVCCHLLVVSGDQQQVCVIVVGAMQRPECRVRRSGRWRSGARVREDCATTPLASLLQNIDPLHRPPHLRVTARAFSIRHRSALCRHYRCRSWIGACVPAGCAYRPPACDTGAQPGCGTRAA